jgi:hypothetical protein
MTPKQRLAALQLVCNRCGHRWVMRTIEPKQCPACRSPYWNQERTRKVAPKQKAQSRAPKGRAK